MRSSAPNCPNCTDPRYSAALQRCLPHLPFPNPLRVEITVNAP
jgi:hypothetical protein